MKEAIRFSGLIALLGIVFSLIAGRAQEHKPAMLTDGSYTVVYKVEGQTIRTFPFQVKGGQVQRMARNQLGYTPHSDFLSPRIIAIVNRDPVMQDVYWIHAGAR